MNAKIWCLVAAIGLATGRLVVANGLVGQGQ